MLAARHRTRAGSVATPAQSDRARESLVKAAFLHKFASFVDWPDGTFARPDSPLRIGVFGDEQIWRDLRELARDRDRDGHPVTVTRIGPGDSFVGYHILYLKAASPARITELLPLVPEGVLTVADSDGAHPRGTLAGWLSSWRAGRWMTRASARARGRRVGVIPATRCSGCWARSCAIRRSPTCS